MVKCKVCGREYNIVLATDEEEENFVCYDCRAKKRHFVRVVDGGNLND